MKLENFITSHTGLVHFIESLLAILFGTLILFLKKGTAQHKVIKSGVWQEPKNNFSLIIS